MLEVKPITLDQSRDWLLKKHYAHRIPGVISYQFGLYDSGVMCGVCVLGLGNRVMNDGYAVFDGKLKVETIELQRLVINEPNEKNTLSRFVSMVLVALPQPCCVYSYADSNVGHHGYIYQATNWIYTGMSKPRTTFFDTRTNEFIHERTLSGLYGTSAKGNLPSYIEIGVEEGGKHRYFYFLGNKKQVKEMRRNLKYPVLPYPKGDNMRYDASYQPLVQGILF